MSNVKTYLARTTSAAPLAFFRIAFGLMIVVAMVRFWLNGWIDALYIQPAYFFSYYGLEFVTPLGSMTYALFAVCALSAFFVAIGFFYRASSIALFLSFTYIELMDKATYLNHYYFISLMCLMLVFLPAGRYFSADAWRHPQRSGPVVNQWAVDSIKILVCLLYFFAGLAKVNSDWLLHALPLKIWLPAKNDLPMIGGLFNYIETAFIFSWLGCLYDLSIPFLLLYRKTRWLAFGAVVVFHGLTAALFPIGMFPYIMIVTATIFFSPQVHEKFFSILGRLLKLPLRVTDPVGDSGYSPRMSGAVTTLIVVFFLVQVAMPLRHWFYPGELFWTEQGYRFSWRVMLMEKAGYAQFTVKDETGKAVVVDNSDFLTPLQEKMMATQPDMIVQYAHILEKYYGERGFRGPQVYVDSYVAVNGRLGQPMIDPRINLALIEDSFSDKSWIAPFNDKISGL